ncbi:hypothetical protein Taro_036079 [Colocasia esculenta]|uniref:Uncharacterized protein n=1 Tax=Colocasia esculenta TaxID=4460 RepID=A0A843W8L8_COLES|nr:hypothetical protein [Colocasia esculenta]
MQQPGYGYMQAGAYPGPPLPYNVSQPPYASYPPPPASSGYSSGWDQTSNPPSQQTTVGTGYDYYNQQQPQKSIYAVPPCPDDAIEAREAERDEDEDEDLCIQDD